jgi:hypothetical protein
MVEKMSRVERAKQFMPFSPLKGYDDLVSNKERIYTTKRELAEDDLIALNNKLLLIKKRDMVKITYYDTDAYVTILGMVSSIDIVYNTITVVKTKISFKDISDINLI